MTNHHPPAAAALLFLLLVVVVTTRSSSAWSNTKRRPSQPSSALSGTRRDALSTLLQLSAPLVLSIAPPAATAFDNKISNKYDDRPKRRGPKPSDLGVRPRKATFGDDEYIGLKSCGPAPDCFSSTIPDDEDHAIPAWRWPSGYDQARAFEDLTQVLESYPPGQNGVDGGGFKIQEISSQKGYAYVQYEALKNGYIDDVEFAVIDGYPKRSLQVRSSSRVGYLDFGVNAKRLNWIAAALRAKGWDAAGVDFAQHRYYAEENQLL